jgi:transcriptional regulator with XRE-family HTH domain
MRSLGLRIQKLRENAKLSKGALARQIGVTRSAISQLELGLTNNPRPENLLGLATVFGMTVEDMVKGTAAESKVQQTQSGSSQVVVLSNVEADLIHRIGGDQELAKRLIGLLDAIKPSEPPGAESPKKRRGH